jgi:hypothetical protein
MNFLDSMGKAKVMYLINANVAWDHLSENYFDTKIYRTNYFWHKIFAIYGIQGVEQELTKLFQNKKQSLSRRLCKG